MPEIEVSETSSPSTMSMDTSTLPVKKKSTWASWWFRQAKLTLDEDNYAANLAACSDEDFSDLDGMGFLVTTGLKDKMGRPVAAVVAKNYQPHVVSRDRLYRYFITRCDQLASSGYSLVWFHTESTYFKNCPSVAWMWAIYERLPERYRTNLQHIFVVHCDLSLWMSTMTVCPWFSGLLWRKICWISRVEFLWDYMAKEHFNIPEFVVEHDKILEDQPLHDYGMVASSELTKTLGHPGAF